jgi:hypothetical protein
VAKVSKIPAGTVSTVTELFRVFAYNPFPIREMTHEAQRALSDFETCEELPS